LDATRDLAVVNVQAWDNTFCNHGIIENIGVSQSKGKRSSQPAK
jgi:hypothetical protein